MTNDIVIPTPELVIPGFTELPDAIQAAIEALSKPFPLHDVKLRPAAVRRDGTAALCLAYGEWWTGYLPRLNDVIGPNNWSIDLEPWGADQIIARMTAFGGLIRKASTGSAKGETNGAAEAEAQAKKRVCAESVLLGLFFYFLPNVWGKGERVGKDFSFTEGEEQRCVYEMYARAGLLPPQYAGASIEQPRPPTRQPFAEPDRSAGGSSQPARSDSTPSSASVTRAQPAPAGNGRRPDPQRVATARAALAQAEHSVSIAYAAQEPPATDPQIGKIVVLVQASPASHAAIDHLGARFGFSALSTLDSKAALKQANPGLARRKASELIDALQRLASEH